MPTESPRGVPQPQPSWPWRRPRGRSATRRLVGGPEWTPSGDSSNGTPPPGLGSTWTRRTLGAARAAGLPPVPAKRVRRGSRNDHGGRPSSTPMTLKRKTIFTGFAGNFKGETENQRHKQGRKKEKDDRAPQHSTTRQHSATGHNTGGQGTTEEAPSDGQTRHGHQSRHTTPNGNARQAEAPADPQQQAASPGTNNIRHQKQHRRRRQHNARAPAQRSRAPHRAGRTGNTQHDSPEHTQQR